MTAVAPLIWGTTYAVTTELLPLDKPFLAAAIRALPAGLLLFAATRRLPQGTWWWKAALLGALNIGMFFALLFIAAHRLPGGVAATIGAVQPLLVAVMASRWIGERLTSAKIVAAAVGLAGVVLLVLQSQARLDAVGVAAALGGTASMAAGVVLAKKWGQPATSLAVTSWQLTAGGLLLVPLALFAEGPLPTQLSALNLAGYAYLSLVGTALAYALWFRGLQLLPAFSASLLGLLSPVVATATGWLILHQQLSPGQTVGALLILGTLVAANLPRRTTAEPAPAVSCPAARRTAPAGSSRAVNQSRGKPSGTARKIG
ncbi:EamA family transporter [Arthrobacter sp. NPDC055138]